MDIECTINATSDYNYTGDGGIWRGYLNYSNGLSVPIKASVLHKTKSFTDAHSPVARIILIVDSRKTYRNRVSLLSDQCYDVFQKMLKDAVFDFWPKEKKCPFGKEI